MPADTRGLRLSILGITVVALFLALFGRLWYLQVMAAPQLRTVASADQVRTVQVAPMRGRIIDRHGRILADNRATLTVVVERAAIRKPSDRAFMWSKLSGVLKTTPQALERRYQSGRFSPYLAFPAADDVDEPVAVYLKERREDYPGVDVQEGWQRVYRYAPIASQIIGYIGAIPAKQASAFTKRGYRLSDHVGVAGVEETYESELRGKPGYVKYAVNAANRIVSVLEQVPPTPGNDVRLTIDLKVQLYTEQLLQAGLEEARTHLTRATGGGGGRYYPAPSGAIVVEDPTSGALIAMASNPTYDNRWFIKGISNEKFDELFPNGPRSPLVDRAVSGGYQIGSTMKLITSVAALTSGQLSSPFSTIDDTGTYEIPYCKDTPQACVRKNAGILKPGIIDLSGALAMSSDVFFYKLGAEMWIYKDKPWLQNTATQFGFGTHTGLDLPSEAAGAVPSRALKKQLLADGVITKAEGADYYPGDNVQFAVGQGLISVSPLQLANAYSTFANGGDRLRPRVAMAVYPPGGIERTPGVVDLTKMKPLKVIERTVLNRVNLDPVWREAILQGLRGVVHKASFPTGTGYATFKDYNFDAMPIYGKTGTAQAADQQPQKDTSLFVGVGPDVPGVAPQYAVSAVLAQAGYGAEAAAPVVKCVFKALSNQLPTPMADPVPSDPLDPNASQAATIPPLADRSCVHITQTGVRD
jgi:penicillin-binding protein 2